VTGGETMLSRAELADLREYSCSLPTGTTIGTRWRRDVNAYRSDRRGVPSEWVIGEYFDDGTPGMVAIRWTWAVDEERRVHRGDPRAPRQQEEAIRAVVPPPPAGA